MVLILNTEWVRETSRVLQDCINEKCIIEGHGGGSLRQSPIQGASDLDR